ncbi:hypothetical protein ACFOOP_00210 [Marinicaulis aureus]|uniref:Uncharacterized protein n=1 Tax=Hyphococcus aureus TaxID=2666033 RepID=A0ABW1L0R7_9PROT
MAVEQREGKKIVVAIGREALALNGAPNTEVLHPFDSKIYEPEKVDAIAALINHSVYEISSRLPKKPFAPSLTLISDEEIFFKPNTQREIMQRCGFRKITVVRDA